MDKHAITLALGFLINWASSVHTEIDCHQANDGVGVVSVASYPKAWIQVVGELSILVQNHNLDFGKSFFGLPNPSGTTDAGQITKSESIGHCFLRLRQEFELFFLTPFHLQVIHGSQVYEGY